jgi:hypothetical protein
VSLLELLRGGGSMILRPSYPTRRVYHQQGVHLSYFCCQLYHAHTHTKPYFRLVSLIQRHYQGTSNKSCILNKVVLSCDTEIWRFPSHCLENTMLWKPAVLPKSDRIQKQKKTVKLTVLSPLTILLVTIRSSSASHK